MTPYLPHSEKEIEEMLNSIGISSIDSLFSDIPESIKLKENLKLPDSKSEFEVMEELQRLSEANTSRTLFAGGGIYDHIIPSVVAHLAGRSEFVTAYTPYQPEISQGMLQALFEFQSAMAEITGLPVANASMYDGYTAAAEACLMAVNSVRKADRILIASTVHPFTKKVLLTFFKNLDIKITELEETGGIIKKETLEKTINEYGESTAGVLLQSPNIYGAVEDPKGWAEIIHEHGAKFIISANPLSLGLLKSQAEWGADIAVGDTQPLGLPPYFGGPSAGYITCREKLMRRMPGRIVGETVDSSGKRAFVLTLQAREQHIKRERATSNICSNQSLAALTNIIYLTAIGKKGFRGIAERNVQAAESLREQLADDFGMEEYTKNKPVFNEFTLRIPVSREKWEKPFLKRNIMPGIWLNDFDKSYPEDLFLVTVTEKRTLKEIEMYIECVQEALD